jgi:hypothetical protein
MAESVNWVNALFFAYGIYLNPRRKAGKNTEKYDKKEKGLHGNAAPF